MIIISNIAIIIIIAEKMKLPWERYNTRYLKPSGAANSGRLFLLGGDKLTLSDWMRTMSGLYMDFLGILECQSKKKMPKATVIR